MIGFTSWDLCLRFLLVFAGEVAPIEHRWNQHGLGGDNVRGSCRDLHPGPVSLLHWSGSGKPWFRLDSRRPCPLDSLWAPYDLSGHSFLCYIWGFIVSASWLVDHMVELGFSRSLSELIGSNLKRSGDSETWAFNLD
ncbi:unnamed protein product [Eruca vesicaria subsp. sativa]|uniref:Hexosyltransferase n=1 Tax=Eruca vesicaria subsp. sativa TaxID=29727 RepID=A0ABC8LT69_ERUVS|nr:unnamed protein product [Eruca vesicaria subsp. sativa]